MQGHGLGWVFFISLYVCVCMSVYIYISKYIYFNILDDCSIFFFLIIIVYLAWKLTFNVSQDRGKRIPWWKSGQLLATSGERGWLQVQGPQHEALRMDYVQWREVRFFGHHQGERRYIYTYMYNTHIYVCIYMHIHVNAYIHIQIYMNTYIWIYIHECMYIYRNHQHKPWDT